MNDIQEQETSQTASMPGWDSDAARQFCNQGQVVAQAMTGWNRECSRFVSHRVSQTVEAAAQVVNCRSLPEVFAVQARWLQAAFDDYMKETKRLMELRSDLIGNMVLQGGQVEIRQGPAKG